MGLPPGGLVRQRVSLPAWVAIRPPTEFGADKAARCFLINVDLLAARGSPRVALEDNLHVRPFCGSRLSSGMFLAFLFGAIGAIVAEVLKRWQQWNDMPEKRFLALLKSIEFWAITVFLILLGGSVGVFEGTKTHPIDWSLCFFVGVGAISTVRNFLSGVAAHGGPRAKRRRLKRQLSRSRVPDGGLSGKGQFAKLEQEGDTRYVHKAALETLGRLQEPVLEETERALQKAIRLNPQDIRKTH